MSLENNEEMVVKPFWFPVPDGLLFTPETINENASVMDEAQTDVVDEKIRVEDNVPQRSILSESWHIENFKQAISKNQIPRHENF